MALQETVASVLLILLVSGGVLGHSTPVPSPTLPPSPSPLPSLQSPPPPPSPSPPPPPSPSPPPPPPSPSPPPPPPPQMPPPPVSCPAPSRAPSPPPISCPAPVSPPPSSCPTPLPVHLLSPPPSCPTPPPAPPSQPPPTSCPTPSPVPVPPVRPPPPSCPTPPPHPAPPSQPPASCPAPPPVSQPPATCPSPPPVNPPSPPPASCAPAPAPFASPPPVHPPSPPPPRATCPPRMPPPPPVCSPTCECCCVGASGRLLEISSLVADFYLRAAYGLGIQEISLDNVDASYAWPTPRLPCSLAGDLISEFARNTYIQFRSFQRMGNCTSVHTGLQKAGFVRAMDAAFGEQLTPAFDPFASHTNILLSSMLLSPYATAASVNVLPELEGRDMKMVGAELVGAFASQDAAMRALLEESSDELVEPYKYTVSDFLENIFKLQRCMDLLNGVEPVPFRDSIGVIQARSAESVLQLLRKLGLYGKM